MDKLEVHEGPAGVKLYKIKAKDAHAEFKITNQESVITKWNPKDQDHAALIQELAAKIPAVSTIKPNAQLKFAEGTNGFNEIAQTVGHKPTLIDRILGRQRIPLKLVNEFAKRHKTK